MCLYKNSTIALPKESIRFRIIANSNSADDQKIKKEILLKLKENLETVMKNSTDINISRKNIQKLIPNINKIIDKTLKELNANDDYNIKYGYNYFPKKIYKGIEYKEGEYESLVITLGEGNGENFWCVLFPPLCLLETDDTTQTEKPQYTSLIKEIINKYILK